MLWVGQKVCLLSPLDLPATPPWKTESVVYACTADATFPSFYQKHLEPLNSYSVRILKHSNQSFHNETIAESYKFKGDFRYISLFLQVWELARKHTDFFVSMYSRRYLQYRSSLLYVIVSPPSVRLSRPGPNTESQVF